LKLLWYDTYMNKIKLQLVLYALKFWAWCKRKMGDNAEAFLCKKNTREILGIGTRLWLDDEDDNNEIYVGR